MNTFLSQEESDRFAAYLEHEAATTDGLIEQMKKVGGLEPMIRRMAAESAACRIIAAKLRSTERMAT